jgi:hypothetical protein
MFGAAVAQAQKWDRLSGACFEVILDSRHHTPPTPPLLMRSAH